MVDLKIHIDDLQSPSLICDNSGIVMMANKPIKNLVNNNISLEVNVKEIFIDLDFDRFKEFSMIDSRILNQDSDFFAVVLVKISEKFNLLISYPNDSPELIEGIYRKANFDQLTNLPNRNHMLSRFKMSLGLAERTSQLLGIFFIDLDNFKTINDTYGHKSGDHFLCSTSDVLKNSIRTSDSVCRWGGDEFLMLCTNFKSINYIDDMCKRIIANIGNEINEKNGYECNLDISLGVSIYPKSSDNINNLIDIADKAMYEAKKIAGSSYVILY